MGHVRLGRLPKTLRWQNVVGMLDDSPQVVPSLARATVAAAESRLAELSGDPALSHCFWLLTRITAASRQDDFSQALASFGLPAPSDGLALSYIAQLSDQTRNELSPDIESGPFGELASLALRRALSETVGVRGRSLFGSSIEDLQEAFRAHSSPGRFGELARRFFGDYFARTLSYLLEHELSNQVGAGHRLRTIDDSQEFVKALDVYTRESSRIVEEFAAGWYSKHNWESGGAISLAETRGFIAVALRKLRMELRRSEL